MAQVDKFNNPGPSPLIRLALTAINPAAGAAFGAVQDGKKNPDPIPDASAIGVSPQASSSEDDSITRRMKEIDAQSANDPHAIIKNGVDALDHPDVPSHIVMQAAPILLGAHHFGGYHPAMDQYMNQGSGEIENG